MVTVSASTTHSAVIVTRITRTGAKDEIKIQQGNQKIYISEEMALSLISAISTEAQ